MTDSSGNIEAQYAYLPFCESIKRQGAMSSDFQTDGYFKHPRSSLNLTLHRPYNAQFGRWMVRDPLEEVVGANLYNFVDNDPINMFDPFGLKAKGKSKRTSSFKCPPPPKMLSAPWPPTPEPPQPLPKPDPRVPPPPPIIPPVYPQDPDPPNPFGPPPLQPSDPLPTGEQLA